MADEKQKLDRFRKNAENIIAFAMLHKSTSEPIRGALTALKVPLSGTMTGIVQAAYKRALHKNGINIAEMEKDLAQSGYIMDDVLPAQHEQDIMGHEIGYRDIVTAAMSLNDMERVDKMFGLVRDFASGDINSIDFRLLMADTLEMKTDTKLVDKNDAVEILKKQPEKPDSVLFGFSQMDRLCDGIRKSRMTILASRPGVGKSDIAMHIARENIETGRNVLIASIEMDKEEILERLTIPVGKGFMAKHEDRKKRRIDGAEYLRDVADGNYYIYDDSKMTVAQIAARATNGIDLVIVDYMQLVKAERHFRSEYERVTAISDSLRAAAKDSKAAWLVLSQLSRPPTKTDVSSRTPVLSDLRGSGSLEQDAFAVLLMNLDGPRIEKGDQPILLNLAKNRGGRTLSIQLMVNRILHTWTEVGSK